MHWSVAVEDNYSVSDTNLKDLCIARLLSLGLQNGGADGAGSIPQALQWLSISLAGSVVKDAETQGEGLVASSVSPSMKKAVVVALYRSIHSSLQSHGGSVSSTAPYLDTRARRTGPGEEGGNIGEEALFCRLNAALLHNPVTMSLVVDVLAGIGCTHSILYGGAGHNATSGISGKGYVSGAACIVHTGSSQLSSGSRGLKRTSVAVGARARDKNDNDDLLPLPDLVRWLAEVGAGQHRIVTVSVCRLVGRLFEAATRGSAAAAVPAVATSELTLRAVVDAIIWCISAGHGSVLENSAVLLPAMTALWRIVHCSEKAKSVVKSMALCSALVEADFVGQCSRDGGTERSELLTEAYYSLHKLLVVVP